jgi:general stress protein 26
MQAEMKEAALRLVRLNPHGLLTTVTEGKPRCRTMQTARIEDDFTIWFATYGQSGKVDQIRANASVCVSYYIPGIDLNVYGEATLLADQQLKDELWQDDWRKHFSGGKTDPNYLVIKVDPTRVEFRDILHQGHEPVLLS